MKFQNKNILIISPEPWSHIFVSKHHYAIHLAKNQNKVFFLNPPGRRFERFPTQYANLWSIQYKGFVRGLRFFPRLIQRLVIRYVFMKLEKLCGASFDVVWSFDNSVFYDFDALPASILTISHIVDLNQNFQTERAASTAQFCFCTTDPIKERLLKSNPHVYKINHGFNVVKHNKTISLPGKARKKTIYSGNLSMPYIDWSIMYTIVKDNADVDFHFIGPNGYDFNEKTDSHHIFKRRLFDFANVFMIGKIEADLIPAYLMSADILLVSYQEKYFQDQANPHKMMEYLGSGKVIVSSFTKEFEDCRDLIEMSKKNEDLPSIFKRVANNLEYFNSVRLQQQRTSFALRNTYDNQILKIEEIITSNE